MWKALSLFYLNLALGTANITITDVHNKLLKMPDLATICNNLNLVNPDSVNKTCMQQLQIVCSNVTLFMTMLDASSRYPFTGLGALQDDIGNFDQCLSIDYTQNGTRILGQHCRDGLVIPDYFGDPSVPTDYVFLAVCRPDGCNSEDYTQLTLRSLHANFVEVFFDDSCQDKNNRKDFGTDEIITLSIFGIVIILMFISTVLDIQHKNPRDTHPLLLAFSVLSNGRNLFHISKRSTSQEQIYVLQGLRVFSMMWIVAGHGFMTWRTVPWAKDAYAGYINSAPLAVDTFFLISGFLTAFQYMKNKEKSLISQLLYVPVMFAYRYLRLTPALLMMYLVTISIFTHLGSGPYWDRNDHVIENCKENWWAVFLYVQNYNNYLDVCLPQTWFVSVLMQLFIVSPIALIPLSFILRRPYGLRYSMITLFVLNIFFIIIPMAQKILADKYDNEYDTQSKLTDYIMGVMLGIFMRENIGKPFLHLAKDHRKAKINILMWCLAILQMLSMVVCYQLAYMLDKDNSRLVYQSLIRPIWCMGLSWIVYSCHHGYGGFIEWILCRPAYQILGKLTYSIFLVHQSVIDYYTNTTRGPWYFTDYRAFYLFCGHYVVSVIIAVFWTLSFESPIIVIEKYLIKKCSKSTQKDIPALKEDILINQSANRIYKTE